MDNHKQSSPNLSDDSIRRFLLGQLNASERSIFEERLFTDSDLETRVRMAEYELADEYAFKRLSDDEMQSFRERYLLVADRRQKLEVSQAIRDRFAPASIRDHKASIRPGLTTRFDIRRPAWRYSFAALILVLILATVFLVTREPEIVRVIIPHRLKAKPQATATPQATHHATNTSSPPHAEQKVPEPVHETPLIVALNSNGNVAEPAPVSLPSGENAILRFRLSPGAAGGGVYRADVLTTAGEKVFSAETLKPYGANPSLIDFDVPAGVLKNGQYQINLRPVDDQAKPEVLQYYFRIQ